MEYGSKKQFYDEIIDAKQDKNPDYNEILRSIK